MMAVRRVFILWTHSLFHETVRALLNDPQVELLGSSQDYSKVQVQISEQPPDILVVEEEDYTNFIKIIDLLKNQRENIRVVGLNLLDNEMSVFEFHQKTVCKADDLLQWVLVDNTTPENEE
jgi:DNA-binding NarL/FixJ family response regulator